MNLRPSGYEPDELPGCSTPRHPVFAVRQNTVVLPFPSNCKAIVSCKGRPANKWVGLEGVPYWFRAFDCFREDCVAFCRPGSDLLSRVLRRSTIGAGAFHGRVRNGNGCGHPAMTTRSAKRNDAKHRCFCCLLWQTFPARLSLAGVPKRIIRKRMRCFALFSRSWRGDASFVLCFEHVVRNNRTNTSCSPGRTPRLSPSLCQDKRFAFALR